MARISDSLGATLDQRHRSLAETFCLSADTGHAIHPNYPNRHDPANQPLLNSGPLLKINANQRYATDGRGAALWRRICRKAGVHTQEFVSNNAMPCGSTIGPLTATRLGIATIDVGIPTLSMHSARELAGTDDPLALTRAMEAFLTARTEDRCYGLGLSAVALTIGIVGLPNAGKSTLFNALTRNDVLAASYPFATIDPNIGVVGVPDPRLAVLAKLFHSDRTVPATVSFVDIAGIVRGASKGEGMGNAFLSHIREADAICQVTRVFEDPDVTHVDGAVNPASDIETIETELILADLQTVEKVLPRLEKEARINKDKIAALAAVKQAQEVLESGRTIFAAGLDRGPLRDLFLLTAKPFLYVFNCDSDELANEPLKQRLRALVAPAEAIFLDAKIESELVEMEPDEAREFLAEMDVAEPGLDVLARVGFDTLGLQTFLTAGPKESRAWTIRKGCYGSRGRRRHPQRFSEGLHQSRSRLVR